VSETSFVLGTPDETAASIRKTVELAKWYAPTWPFFLALTPWPYDEVTRDLGMDQHVATRDYRRYNLVEPVMKPDNNDHGGGPEGAPPRHGHFFHHKFQNLDKLSPPEAGLHGERAQSCSSRELLGHEMKHMASGAEMPESVRKMLAELGPITGRCRRAGANRKAG